MTTTIEEREAKARVKALSEGVRVSLLERTADMVRYVAMSTTHPGIAYQVILRDPDTGINECNCPAGSHGTPCKHLAAAEMMYAAQLELSDPKHARGTTELSQVHRDKLERELAEIGL